MKFSSFRGGDLGLKLLALILALVIYHVLKTQTQNRIITNDHSLFQKR